MSVPVSGLRQGASSCAPLQFPELLTEEVSSPADFRRFKWLPRKWRHKHMAILWGPDPQTEASQSSEMVAGDKCVPVRYGAHSLALLKWTTIL